jgi:DNA relaxase NicK
LLLTDEVPPPGQPASEAYWVGSMGRKSGGIKFDGFENGVLLEAKGPGCANKIVHTPAL